LNDELGKQFRALLFTFGRSPLEIEQVGNQIGNGYHARRFPDFHRANNGKNQTADQPPAAFVLLHFTWETFTNVLDIALYTHISILVLRSAKIKGERNRRHS
jgi:hypothetical protein